MRDSPRDRILIEFLVRELKALASELHPDDGRQPGTVGRSGARKPPPQPR